MAQKTFRFTWAGITNLPENKPVVYIIRSKSGRANYVGFAKRGRVQERISEHLPNGPDAIPGAKVVVEPVDDLANAKQKQMNMIKRMQPTYNKQGK